MKNFGIYAIISQPALSHEIVAEAFAEEEVAYLQLREKKISDKHLLELAKKIKEIIKGSKTKLVINDRADIAKLVEADVLHLGQDDLPYSEVKKLLGNDIKIGLSTHNIEQLNAALHYNPNYVGFGPVFPTTTKEKPDPIVGTQMLKIALGISTVPVVAIGGIFPYNIDEVLKVGAKNICMVRYFMQSTSKQELKNRIKYVKLKISEYDTDAASH